MKPSPNPPLLIPGFIDPVLDSQAVFRTLLTAMSRPGEICPLPLVPQAPGALTGAAAAVCLTLLDLDTPVWLDNTLRQPEVMAHLRFHCGCPIVEDPAQAAFALIGKVKEIPCLAIFNPGVPEYPDASTTLVVQVQGLTNKQGVYLQGPGIENEVRLGADFLLDHFWHELAGQRRSFPLGLDVFLVSPKEVAALPRSVTIKEAGPCMSR
ncbi:MAG: phosphonate C-P lyase system protein PhnH [Desulfarculaceae bacterium]